LIFYQERRKSPYYDMLFLIKRQSTHSIALPRPPSGCVLCGRGRAASDHALRPFSSNGLTPVAARSIIDGYYRIRRTCRVIRKTLLPMEMESIEQRPASKKRAAVFLDRDGVINRKLPENEYVRRVSDFQFLQGAVKAISILRETGFVVVVITNQRGIARGLMTEEDLAYVHRFMLSELRQAGVVLEGVFHCPHEKFENCRCRKPQPGMILEAAKSLRIDLTKSYMVGDSPSDIEAGKRAGTKTVLIGNAGDCEPDLTFPRLLDFSLFLSDQRPD
jgi:D-glycero-D-manno-heptose 1,7-bisphosphate phosphatase